MTTAAPSPLSRLRGPAVVLLLVVAVAAVWSVWNARALVSEDEVESAVLSGIASESPEGFVVTGRLTSGTTTRSARRWRVRLLNLEAGRSMVTVALPGEVTYGFPLDALTADDIAYLDGGTVEIRMPPLEVFSVEPVLEEAVVDAQVSGTARLTPEMTERTLQTALRRVRPALRRQAEGHLAASTQPRQNAALALRRMLTAPLEAAGVRGARFRFVLAPGDTLELSPDGRRQTLSAE